MAKRARDSKSAAAKRAAPAPSPNIPAINPTSFIDGDTYTVGFSLQNFTSVRSASFSQSHPQAAFSNTTVFTRFPDTGAPQQILFPLSKFSYSGTASTSATITATVTISAGNAVTRSFTVNYHPKRQVAPVVARSKAPVKGRATS